MTGSEWFDSRQGGLNRYFEDLYRAFQAHPDVEVEAAAFGEPPSGGESWGPVQASLPSRLYRSFRHERHAAAADVLDTHFALYPLAVRRRPGQLRIIHFQGPWARESEQAGHSSRSVALKRRLERHVYRQADRVIVLSDAFRAIAIHDYGVDPKKVVVIPPGVDTTKFTPGPPREPGTFRVVCVRRLEHRMGIQVLLAAWREVILLVPYATLDIYGAGTYADELHRLTQQFGLTDSVTYHGRGSDKDIVRAYQNADCSVVPSVALEGFGLIALESLACGTPVIVTDCGGLPDAVSGLDKSLIVPTDEPEALGRRLVTAAHGALPKRATCRDHIEVFGWTIVARAHIALIASASAGN